MIGVFSGSLRTRLVVLSEDNIIAVFCGGVRIAAAILAARSIRLPALWRSSAGATKIVQLLASCCHAR